jgi:hypothetical protein
MLALLTLERDTNSDSRDVYARNQDLIRCIEKFKFCLPPHIPVDFDLMSKSKEIYRKNYSFEFFDLSFLDKSEDKSSIIHTNNINFVASLLKYQEAIEFMRPRLSGYLEFWKY